MRIDSGSVNYFLRAYFQYVLIPLVIIGIISYIVPEEEHYPPLFYIIITAFILILFLIISFHEYFSIKKKSKISTLFIRQGELYVNNKKKAAIGRNNIYNPIVLQPANW